MSNMTKEDMKNVELLEKAFELLNDKDKFSKVMERWPQNENENAQKIMSNFCEHPLDFYKLINNDYKKVFIELILREIGYER